MTACRPGILDVASKLFHVTFKPVPDAPGLGPVGQHVRCVSTATQQLGRIYLDMHPRPGKDQWFSSNQILDGVKGKQLPEAALVCNFSGGKPGEPGLMEYGEVTTFFHEFGHLMHWIFQGQQQWAGYGNNLESGFRRGAVANAGRVDARSQGTGDVCAELPDE